MANNTRKETHVLDVQPGWLDAAVVALAAAGVHVLAPVQGEDGVVDLAPVAAAKDIALDYVNTRMPLKAIFLPRTEILLRYRKKPDSDTELLDQPGAPAATVVIGCRPCDAAAVAVLDAVFNWDFEDMPWRSRRDSITIVTFACRAPGPHCFCEAVGGGLDDERGSDVLVTPAQNGGAVLKALSEKGARFAQLLGAPPFPPAASPTQSARAGGSIDLARVRHWLDGNFENELWADLALRCLGCGVCTYLCPTCHCFDIVDEASWNHGERRRNWDSCAFRQFTLHASGHNPRPNQTARWRQRIMHKFKYFPEKFGTTACVGCGRCAAGCSAGQNLHAILERIEALAAADMPQQKG